jgi:hypothetical protein
VLLLVWAEFVDRAPVAGNRDRCRRQRMVPLSLSEGCGIAVTEFYQVFSAIENCRREFLVEADTLKTHTSHGERTRGVKLGDFKVVGRTNVRAVCERLLEQSLTCLRQDQRQRSQPRSATGSHLRGKITPLVSIKVVQPNANVCPRIIELPVLMIETI